MDKQTRVVDRRFVFGERECEASRIYRRSMGLALGRKSGRAEVESRGEVTKNTAEMMVSKDNETVLPDLRLAAMLRHRVRYFTDGAVIGSKDCVELCFEQARERFGRKRKKGAKRIRGSAKEAAGVIWCARDCGE